MMVVEKLTEGPVLMVGVSLGAWLSLVAAQRMPQDRLHGMVLFAPALNYVRPYYEYHRMQLSPEARQVVQTYTVC